MTQPQNDLKSFIRGGQIVLHNFRMFGQISGHVILITLGLASLFTVIIFILTTTQYERYVAVQYCWANIAGFLNKDAVMQFIEPDNSVMQIKFTDLTSSLYVQNIIHNVTLKIIRALIISVILGSIIFWLISYKLTKKGENQTADLPVAGDELATKAITAARIKKNSENSDLIFSGLPLLKNKETAHLLFHGTTGTGKSNAIKELLDQIRARHDKVIIYDKSCNYTEEFYLPNQDILLNPLDNRSEPWNLWAECRDSADFDSIAAAQIPMPLSTQDPFWINAARTIFAAAAFEMRNDPDRSIEKLLRFLLTADLNQIQKYLKGTEAETLVSDKIEKTAISIKSVLATYLKSMKYIKDDPNPFSIRRWIQNDKNNNWLFITSIADKHETLKPIITTWLDLAVNTLLSLPPDPDRRIWLILDEIASLQQLPYLTPALSEARKFGGCAVIGIQNIAQLEKLYGSAGAREISSLLNTRFMFRQPDPIMAEWSAKNLGESIIEEVREGISYGANTMRDGVSINRVETRKPVVNASEIMSLGDLYAYVRLPGKYPITLIDFIYTARIKKNSGFIARKIDETKMKNLDALFDQEIIPPKIINKAKQNPEIISALDI